MTAESPYFSDELFLVLNGDFSIAETGSSTEDALGRDLVGKNFLNLLGPAEQIFFRTQTQVAQAKKILEFELSVLWPQDSPHLFRWRLKKKDNRFHLLGRDLHDQTLERNEAQKALERWNLAVAATGLGIWESNHMTEELMWDDQMYSLHGLRRSDFSSGHELFNLVFTMMTPEDQYATNHEIKRLRQEGQDLNVRYRIHHPSGELRYIRAMGKPLMKGGEKHYFGIAWDETEAFKNRNLQREQEAKMLASAKMAALGEMSGGIAHEINNPLTVIQARAFQLQQLAEYKSLDSEKIIQAAESISKTADRIARIIRSLRAFAREGDTDPFDMVSVKQIFDETLEFCHSRFANSGVDIQVVPFNSHLEFEGRRVQIEQVLVNLLNNSFYALQKLDEKWIRLEVYDHATHLELHVIDAGEGIPAEVAEKVMLPFFTTKEVGNGMGLGLSISSSIAKSHQGELSYDARSKNTRFILRLPKFQS